MACSDADGIFTTIETGFASQNSDGGIFRESRLGRPLERLEREGVDLPEDAVLPRDESRQVFPSVMKLFDWNAIWCGHIHKGY